MSYQAERAAKEIEISAYVIDHYGKDMTPEDIVRAMNTSFWRVQFCAMMAGLHLIAPGMGEAPQDYFRIARNVRKATRADRYTPRQHIWRAHEA